ncbi:MAG TPA: hypothetical protein V6C86_21100 [Oculatellaceae cyanobacterium]
MLTPTNDESHDPIEANRQWLERRAKMTDEEKAQEDKEDDAEFYGPPIELIQNILSSTKWRLWELERDLPGEPDNKIEPNFDEWFRLKNWLTGLHSDLMVLVHDITTSLSELAAEEGC